MRRCLHSDVRESRKGETQTGEGSLEWPWLGVVLTHSLAMVGVPVSRDPVRSQDWPCLPLQPLSPFSTYLLAHSSHPGHGPPFFRDTELLPYPTCLPRCCSRLPGAHSLFLYLAGLPALSGSELFFYFWLH